MDRFRFASQLFLDSIPDSFEQALHIRSSLRLFVRLISHQGQVNWFEAEICNDFRNLVASFCGRLYTIGGTASQLFTSTEEHGSGRRTEKFVL